MNSIFIYMCLKRIYYIHTCIYIYLLLSVNALRGNPAALNNIIVVAHYYFHMERLIIKVLNICVVYSLSTQEYIWVKSLSVIDSETCFLLSHLYS